MERKAALNLVVPLMLALALASCGSNSTSPANPPTNNPPTPTPPTPKEVSGTAGGWSGGEAVVRAESAERLVVAEGTISADGSFSLTLPVKGEELAAALFIIDNDFICPGPNIVSTIEITPGPFETVFVENYFSVYESNDSSEVLGGIFPDGLTPKNSYVYGYTPSDATITGECVTTYGDDPSPTLRLDLDYKAGWND